MATKRSSRFCVTFSKKVMKKRVEKLTALEMGIPKKEFWLFEVLAECFDVGQRYVKVATVEPVLLLKEGELAAGSFACGADAAGDILVAKRYVE